jgi:hypothetical protein
MEFLFPERHVFFSDEYVLLFLIPCRTTRLDGSTLDVRVHAAKKKHSTLAQLPPAPWDTKIIRKNNVIDTYASIDYARERNVGHPTCPSNGA